jgi:hypothetical protein
MIIITGPGRGGTSLVASLYRELGFDPGGVWDPHANAGLEDYEVVRANGHIIRDLRLSVLAGREVGERLRSEHSDVLDDTPPPRFRSRVRDAVQGLAFRALGRDVEQLGLMPWERFDAVVDRYRPRLLELASTHPVVKDPRFCWTLGVWAAAGVGIEHVLLCLRNVDAMVESRVAAGQILFKSKAGAKNAMIYGIGLCVASLHDHRIPYSIVQFPDFLEDPEALYTALRFPRPVQYDEFESALTRVRQDSLVHDRR